MVDPEKLATFALMSAAASLVPGPSMLFVMGQSVWRGGSSGARALAGIQFGYVWWWVLAALGLGTLAVTFPSLCTSSPSGVLPILRGSASARCGRQEIRTRRRKDLQSSRHIHFGMDSLVAMSNPKSLIYMVALLPPFVDARSPIVPQLVLLALVAMAIDVALGIAYILAGHGLARAMTSGATRKWLDGAVGTIFLVIGAAILADLLLR